MDLLQDTETIQALSRKSLTPISFQQATELAKELGARAFVPYSSLTQEVSNQSLPLTLSGVFDLNIIFAELEVGF